MTSARSPPATSAASAWMGSTTWPKATSSSASPSRRSRAPRPPDPIGRHGRVTVTMSERTVRVEELLREEISRILARDVDDPRIGFLTITRVEVTPDLRHGTLWASVIGQPAERRTALRALQGAMPFVRGRLGVLRLKRIPELLVREDD
ncbi:MAG: 30S ribosome-binding factor RbfA, partial [Chloroflexota bacterium]